MGKERGGRNANSANNPSIVQTRTIRPSYDGAGKGGDYIRDTLSTAPGDPYRRYR